MKKNILAICAIFIASFTMVNAQVSQVNLEQTPGVFTQESLSLGEGDYQFNIANKGIDHEVGFVLVPKGKYDEANHIKAAYVSAPVPTGKTSATGIVKLKAGEYEYFCPLNPTGKYSLTVLGDVHKLQMGQVNGAFAQPSLVLSEGNYQFEVGNYNIDHNVGFVLVPKGKYDAKFHIKEAYVSAPVSSGSSSLTGVVSLTSGEYEYFCPLNPTDKYPLTVR